VNCPSCGIVVSETADLCGACGTNLHRENVATGSEGRSGERWVTPLWSGVTDHATAAGLPVPTAISTANWAVLAPAGAVSRRAKHWAVAVACVFVAIAGAVVAVIAGSAGHSVLPDGQQSGLITLGPSGSSTFSGTVAGQAVRGHGSGASNRTSVLFTEIGTFGSSSFVIHAAFKFASGQASSTAFTITGRLGSQPVTGTATFSSLGAAAGSLALTILARVGSESLTGTATASELSRTISVTLHIH
jgi:hypothetical protein